MTRAQRIGAVALAALLVVAISCSSGDDDGAAGDATTSTGLDRAASSAGPTSEPAGGGDPVASSDPASVAPEPSDGCGRPPDAAEVSDDDAPGDVPQTLEVAGTERTYRLAVPDGYDPDEPKPLIVNLHGSGSDALQAGVYGDIPHAASDRGMLVVAPNAIDGQWEVAGDGADADFLDALVDDVEGRYCVDRARVHVVGTSLGAFKAASTACGSDRYASAALVTVEVFPGSCRPLPVVAFHGTADPVAAYGEGGSQPAPDGPNPGITGTLDNVAAWADSGGCQAEAELEPVGDDVVVHTYPGCEPGVEVVLYSIEGGGHTWPGSDIIIGPPEMTTQTIDATEIILDFFEAHPKS